MEPNTIDESFNLGSIQIQHPIAAGTWSWGDAKTWGYNGYDKSFNDQTMEESFVEAARGGITLWDTAEVYGWGKSEEFLGQFHKKHPDLPIFIATKFIPLPYNLTQGSLIRSVNASLKRLQVDKIDLYQIHGPQYSIRSVETWAHALAQAVKLGTIREVGVSNYSEDEMVRTAKVLEEYGIKLVSNQVEFSLLRNNPERHGLLKKCQEMNIKVLAYSPLAMGRLSGKYSSTNPPNGDRKFGNHVSLDHLDKLVALLKEIGAKYEKSCSEVAINWVICKGAIPLVGLKNGDQAKQNLGAFGWRLRDEDVQALDQMSLTAPPMSWQHDK
eukprot:TRINITY_DN6838_c0_g2_i1.p1 TRINITY_DN6838_c0_g2~~TRINITY_DN6838_c0_g2_i1.p1  ORF type:complete len:327 (-),score=88.96 TRINITY_DN6838_c0_g2_i1:8-988(-)